jgi:adenylate cyclase
MRPAAMKRSEFSDLKGSTALYDRVGDGPAYSTVHAHFELLENGIAEHGGAIVKTIGDAVMAVFNSAHAALLAAIQIQQRVPVFNARRSHADPITVKMGVHAGPCVAVNANGRLDYFGTTVNVAARVQAQSVGEDVVLPDQLLSDPDVRKLVEEQQVETYTATLSGIAKPFTLLRLTPSVVDAAERPGAA